MADDQVDWNTLARELMQVLSTGESLRPDQPYTSRDPGTKYRSGEVTSDVGLLDPVDLLAGMLASKGATLARGAGRALRPRPGVPRTGGRGLMRSERGSTGSGSWWDDPDDVPFSYGNDLPEPTPRTSLPSPDDTRIPREIRLDLANVRDRIRGAMTEINESSGAYDNPDLIQQMHDNLLQAPGESLLAYLRRLGRLEQRYNPDEIYGPGEYPPSRLRDVLDTYSQTPAGKREAIPLDAAEKRAAEEAAALRQQTEDLDWAERAIEEAKARDPVGWQREETRTNPYGPGEGPAKRTVDLNDPQWSNPWDSPARREKYGHLMDQQGSIEKPRRTVDLDALPTRQEPPSTAQDYAEIIRKLFEREGQ